MDDYNNDNDNDDTELTRKDTVSILCDIQVNRQNTCGHENL